MTDSPTKTERSLPSSRPNPKRKFFDHPASLATLLLLDILLVTLAFYLIQEGTAQRANPHLIFFVKFPVVLLPLAYVATVILIPNFAVTTFTLLRGLRKRRWPWVTTAVSALLLGVIVAKLGLHDVWVIIHPAGGR